LVITKMNEKIRNLAAQAGAPRADYPYETVVLTTVELEKFAESIVQECIGVVTDTTNDSEWDGYNQATACAIKEHFGVK